MNAWRNDLVRAAKAQGEGRGSMMPFPTEIDPHPALT